MVLDRLLRTEKQILMYNSGSLKFYGNGFVKAIVQRCRRIVGFEKYCKTRHERFKEHYAKLKFESDIENVSSSDLLPLSSFTERQVNRRRSASSISRLKARIQDLILSNKWNSFVTFTLDSSKRDRFSTDSFEALTRHLKYIRQTRCPELRYMLLLERHSAGGYHGHALMYLPDWFIGEEFSLNNNGYLEWNDISYRFGFMSIKPYDGSLRACNYVTKYVTKDLIGGRVLRTSKGLNVPFIIRDLSIGFNSSLPHIYWSDFVITCLFSFSNFEKYLNNCDILIESS